MEPSRTTEPGTTEVSSTPTNCEYFAERSVQKQKTLCKINKIAAVFAVVGGAVPLAASAALYYGGGVGAAVAATWGVSLLNLVVIGGCVAVAVVVSAVAIAFLLGRSVSKEREFAQENATRFSDVAEGDRNWYDVLCQILQRCTLPSDNSFTLEITHDNYEELIEDLRRMQTREDLTPAHHTCIEEWIVYINNQASEGVTEQAPQDNTGTVVIEQAPQDNTGTVVIEQAPQDNTGTVVTQPETQGTPLKISSRKRVRKGKHSGQSGQRPKSVFPNNQFRKSMIMNYDNVAKQLEEMKKAGQLSESKPAKSLSELSKPLQGLVALVPLSTQEEFNLLAAVDDCLGDQDPQSLRRELAELSPRGTLNQQEISFVDGCLDALDCINYLPTAESEWDTSYIEGLLRGVQKKNPVAVEDLLRISGRVGDQIHQGQIDAIQMMRELVSESANL